MEQRLTTDIGYVSLNKKGEQLCGDKVEIAHSQTGHDSVTMVLADGLGSGVKANILSTLTSKIISTMMANGMEVADCVATMASTLPVCRQRQVAYSTFTIIQVKQHKQVVLIQYDNPNVIFLRDGKHVDYAMEQHVMDGKKIYVSEIVPRAGDVFVAMSDGAIYAGVGQLLNFGWQRTEIIDFLENRYEPAFSARMTAMLVAQQCDALYNHEPGDDTTVAAVKIRPVLNVNIMIGPPADPDCDADMVRVFLNAPGRHVVCGGTTATIVAQYLGKKVQTSFDYADKNIPPAGKIDGIDLVTEGIITIRKTLEYVKSHMAGTDLDAVWANQKDGASLLAQELFEQATSVTFFVGKAINPAHQEQGLPIGFGVKIRLIEELAACLKQTKPTKIEFF